MDELKKYLIWGPGRTGSMLAANVLQAALYPKSQITCTDIKYIRNLNSPIIHTHNLQMFVDSTAHRLMMVRNIFPAAVSTMIALDTNRYHVYNQDEVEQYVNEFGHRSLHIDTSEFDKMCKKYDREYEEAMSSGVKFDKVHYEQIESEPFRLLWLLKIDKKAWNMQSMITANITKKIPVTAVQQVSNYQELLDRFDRLELKHKRMI
jgi:hypothetical protein